MVYYGGIGGGVAVWLASAIATWMSIVKFNNFKIMKKKKKNKLEKLN